MIINNNKKDILNKKKYIVYLIIERGFMKFKKKFWGRFYTRNIHNIYAS